MREVTEHREFPVFCFHELDEEVQDCLVAGMLEELEEDWVAYGSEWSYECISEELHKEGFLSCPQDMSARISFAQGDGFSFVGAIDCSCFFSLFLLEFPHHRRIVSLCEKEAIEITASCIRNPSLYVHELSCEIYLEVIYLEVTCFENSEELDMDTFERDLFRFLSKKRLEACERHFSFLMDSYEDFVSEEKARERLQELEFEEQGEEYEG